MTETLCVLVLHPPGDENKPYWCDEATVLEMFEEEWEILDREPGYPEPVTLQEKMGFLVDTGDYVFGGVKRATDLAAYASQREQYRTLLAKLSDVQQFAHDLRLRHIHDPLETLSDKVGQLLESIEEYPNEALLANMGRPDCQLKNPL